MLDGGNGNDTIEYGNLTGGVTVNLVAGTATGGGADDTLTSMECVDGTDFGDTLIGTAGPNTFTGKGGNDTLNGDAGNDTLDGAAGDDTLNGGADADNLLPGTGAANVVHGEAGTDMLSYAPVTGAGVSVNLGAGTATGVITLDGIENVTGTNLDDVLIGNGSNNGLTGLAGADTLRGLSGSDPLNGGDGNDTLEGGDSNDSLRPGPGANSVDGGNGVDTVDYSGLTSGGVSVNLGAGATTGAANDSLLNVENATGTKQADSLFGSTLANVLSGLSGADTLDSSGDLAKDTVNGGVDGDTDVCTADATDKVVNCP